MLRATALLEIFKTALIFRKIKSTRKQSLNVESKFFDANPVDLSEFIDCKLIETLQPIEVNWTLKASKIEF